MVNIGGFFASLSLVSDEASFKKGIDLLSEFPKLLPKVAVGAVGVTAAMAGLGAVTANSMTQLAAHARTLGMSAMTLDNWRNAAKLAGGDADALQASLDSMNEAFRNLKIGEVKEDFIKFTGMTGADFGKLQGMNNDQRLRAIWGALENVKDKDMQQALIQKIFGASGVDLFSRLQNRGQTLNQVYNQAAGMNPFKQSDYDAMIKAERDNATIMVGFDNAIKIVGNKIEEALLPALTDLANWLANNKDALKDFGAAVGEITKNLLGLFSPEQDKSKHSFDALILGGSLNAAVAETMEKTPGVNIFDFGSISKIAQGLPKTTSEEARARQAIIMFQTQGKFGNNLPYSVLESLYNTEQSLPAYKQRSFEQRAGEAIQKAEIDLKVNGKAVLSDADSKALLNILSRSGVINTKANTAGILK